MDPEQQREYKKLVNEIKERGYRVYDKLEVTGKILGEGNYGLAVEGSNNEVVKFIKRGKGEKNQPYKTCKEETLQMLLGMPKHANLLGILGVASPEGSSSCVIVSERIHQRPIASEADLVRYCYGMFNGIQAMHENNIIHRDIKPDNIIFGVRNPKSNNPKDNVCVLIDYGFACVMNNPESRLPCRPGWAGSKDYMPTNAREVSMPSFEADIYAAAVTITEICANYQRDHTKTGEIFRKIQNKGREIAGKYKLQKNIPKADTMKYLSELIKYFGALEGGSVEGSAPPRR